MFLKSPNVITITDLLEQIELLRNAELCRDYNTSSLLFEPFWQDYSIDPELPDDTPPGIFAEVLRLAGFYLSYRGKARNIRDYQERAKDLLCRSIRLFESLNLFDKAGEASSMLALCYWYHGAVNESEDILNEVESRYEFQPAHPVYLQICVNRLLTLYGKENKPYPKAFEIINKIQILMEYCQDTRLQAQYHTQSGIFYQLIGRNDLARDHHIEAIKKSRLIGSFTFEALNMNNLALVYDGLENYDEAIRQVDRGIAIFVKSNARGWVANLLDTKAQIRLHQNRMPEALELVSESVEIFSQGEDYLSLANALFLRVKIYLQMNDLTEGMIDFANVISLAQLRLSEEAVKNYSVEFSQLIYVKKNVEWVEEIASFKKHLIIQALLKNGKQVSKSFQSLGLKNHQSLSDKIQNQFPEIYDLLNIPHPPKKKSASKFKKSEQKNTSVRPITLMVVEAEEIAFMSAPDLIDNSVMCFLVESAMIPKHLKLKDAVIFLCRPKRFYRHEMVMMLDKVTNEFTCGQIHYDSFSTTYLIENYDGNQMNSVEDYKIYGEIIGCVPLDEASGARIEFKPLPPS